MVKPNSNQLRIDIDSSQSGSVSPETPEDYSLEVYKHRGTGELITWHEIDNYADARPCSTHEAFLRFGISAQDDIVDANGDYVNEQPPKAEIHNKPKKLNAVNLGERAMHLLGAMNEYDKSRQSSENFEKLRASDADEKAIDLELTDEMTHRYAGNDELSRALGYSTIPKVGFSSIEARAAARDDHEKFLKLSTDPAKKDEREQLAENLNRQIK